MALAVHFNTMVVTSDADDFRQLARAFSNVVVTTI
jgi:hypothetical protein